MHRAILIFLSLIGAALLAQHSDAEPLRDLIQAVPQLPMDRFEPKVHPPLPLEGISAVTADKQGNMYVLHRPANGNPVVVLDAKGNLLRSWGKGMFKIPTASASIQTGTSGRLTLTSAPPATPAARAIQPACRLMSSMTSTRWWLSRGSKPRTSVMPNSWTLSGLMSPSKPSSIPNTSHPYSLMAVFTTARMTALRPGQSPPPVRTPMRRIMSDIAQTSLL
jgi:hypothetical protein